MELLFKRPLFNKENKFAYTEWVAVPVKPAKKVLGPGMMHHI
jgi:hypothetical protein